MSSAPLPPARRRSSRRARASSRRLLVAAVLAGPLFAAQALPGAGAVEHQGGDVVAPLLRAASAAAVPGRYIVVMRPGADQRDRRAAAEGARGLGARVLHEYGEVFSGFAARLPDRALEALRRNPHVAYVEADQEVAALGTQSDPPWGLDRIDQRKRPLSASYGYTATGSGVTAYVIDTGVRRTHRDLGGRVLRGHTVVSDGRGTRDCNGHGTHVAGTVGGRAHGVAKRVTIRPVRVLNCRGTGTTSGIVAGINWVTAHHAAGAPAVANMSLGGYGSAAIDAAVAAGIADGVTFVVAAGNSADDACHYSPSRVPEALTVGSTTRSDVRSSFSNFGPCVDVFAPGSGIKSAWGTGDRATRTISGTSMAAPHAAGAAALFLQHHRSASPATVVSAVSGRATSGAVADATGAPDRLLYVGPATHLPPWGPNLLVDPGFESEGIGWEQSDDVVIGSASARSGGWVARLGRPGASDSQASRQSLTQTVTIPSASSATLTFHLWVRSEEVRDEPYDQLDVQVTSDGVPATVLSFSNFHRGSGYQLRTMSLDAFAGRTVQLRFASTVDEVHTTDFYLDDVAVMAR